MGDPDIFDTWATSSLTPQIAGGWEEDGDLFERVFPMDMRPQGHDIIRTWLFATMTRSHHEFGCAPWKHAALSGWILDPDRKKMSKSKGNVVTPMDLFETYGTDAVRYWAGSARPGVDTAFSEDQMKVGRKLANKLLNVTKFVLQFGAPSDDRSLDDGVTDPIDRSMLAKLDAVIDDATAAFEAFDYARALERTEAFFWWFCDNYVELVKGRTYDEQRPDGADSAKRALREALSAIQRLFAPMLPFAAEESWSWWNDSSVHLAPWPTPSRRPTSTPFGDPTLADVTIEVLTQVRRAKTEAKRSQRAVVESLVVTAPSALHAAIEAGRDDLVDAGSIRELAARRRRRGVHRRHARRRRLTRRRRRIDRTSPRRRRRAPTLAAVPAKLGLPAIVIACPAGRRRARARRRARPDTRHRCHGTHQHEPPDHDHRSAEPTTHAPERPVATALETGTRPFVVGPARRRAVPDPRAHRSSSHRRPPSPFDPPADGGNGRRVVYSKSKQTVWAYDETNTIIKMHRVSGRQDPNDPTPGTYRVWSRSLRTFSINNPTITWNYMVRFAKGDRGGNIGFHDIPYQYGQPVQTIDQLGEALSGGCVRQAPEDADLDVELGPDRHRRRRHPLTRPSDGRATGNVARPSCPITSEPESTPESARIRRPTATPTADEPSTDAGTAGDRATAADAAAGRRRRPTSAKRIPRTWPQRLTIAAVFVMAIGSFGAAGRAVRRPARDRGPQHRPGDHRPVASRPPSTAAPASRRRDRRADARVDRRAARDVPPGRARRQELPDHRRRQQLVHRPRLAVRAGVRRPHATSASAATRS